VKPTRASIETNLVVLPLGEPPLEAVECAAARIVIERHGTGPQAAARIDARGVEAIVRLVRFRIDKPRERTGFDIEQIEAALSADNANSRDFEQLIAKNAGHDVTLENNAQEALHQILEFVHHAVPVQQHADLML
jgi:hypothetical protein